MQPIRVRAYQAPNRLARRIGIVPVWAIVLAAVVGLAAALGNLISPPRTGTTTVEGIVLNGGPPSLLATGTESSLWSVGIASNSLTTNRTVHIHLTFKAVACSSLTLVEDQGGNFVTLTCAAVGSDARFESSAKNVLAGSLAQSWGFTLKVSSPMTLDWELQAFA